MVFALLSAGIQWLALSKSGIQELQTRLDANAVWILVLVLGTTLVFRLASRFTQKKFAWWRFMIPVVVFYPLVLMVGTFATAMVLVPELLADQWEEVLMPGMVTGIITAVLSVPYLLIASCNAYFRARLGAFFRWPVPAPAPSAPAAPTP
jgi:hypothetical protein